MSERGHQCERVLRLLIQRGERGICQRDFLLPNVADGGKPIARLASRIDELRNHAGFKIADAGWRSKYKVYRLLGDSPPPSDPRLFEPTDDVG